VTDDASVVRARAATVKEAAVALRSSRIEGRAHWLANAARALDEAVHRGHRELSDATGLSVAMVDWATRTTLSTVREDALQALVRNARRDIDGTADPLALLSVILAGNVFTASVRGIVVPLLLGIPVLVKASSRDTVFPMMFRDALRSADSRLGASMDLVAFPGSDVECNAALTEVAEAVSVYGSDETVAALTSQVGDTPLIAHGHGVSVAYCGAGASADARFTSTIEKLALDICAYDQRGCLSPQLVYVEETSSQTAAAFARRLIDEGLDPTGRTLPRGPLPGSVGAAQAQWRGMAEVEGALLVGDHCSVSIRAPQPIRWSPAYRNVAVCPVSGLDEAVQAMESIGSHLKCVGTDAGSLPEVRARLAESPTLNAYACPLGEMQTPALDAPADGLPIWHGLFRTSMFGKTR
jgi:acyl-CoA reductase-like NAD-dependent aldehyde dehydrogenase